MNPTKPATFDREAVRAAAHVQLTALERHGTDFIQSLKAHMPRMVLFGVAGGVAFAFIGLAPLGFFAGLVFGAVGAFSSVAGGLRNLMGARAEVLKAVAAPLGLRFVATVPGPSDFSAFEGTSWWGLLKEAQAGNALFGERAGREVMVLDAVIYARSKGPDGQWRKNQPPAWLKGIPFAQARVIRVSIPGRWTARTVIMRDYGLANRISAPAGLASVGLVDRRFEKVFEVFSSDQTEARALLTPTVMERLMALEDLFMDDDEDTTNPVAAFQDGWFSIVLPISQFMRTSNQGQAARSTGSGTNLKAPSVEAVLDELEATFALADSLAELAGR